MISMPASSISSSRQRALPRFGRCPGVREILWTAFTYNPPLLARTPYMNGIIRTGGSNEFAIRGPGYGIHCPLMPAIFEKGLPPSRSPNIDIAIFVAGGNGCAVRGPGDGEHTVDMVFAPMVREKGRSGRAIISIGDLHGLISASRNNEIAIRRPS